jgi:hypothetical protein
MQYRNTYISEVFAASVFRVAPSWINPLNAKLNPICHLLALLGAHPILHINRIRVKLKMCEKYI